MIAEIQALGGDVEFTTVAGNMVIASVPASAVDGIGKIAGALRVVEDSLMEGHLANARTSTMVDPADTSLTGLFYDLELARQKHVQGIVGSYGSTFGLNELGMAHGVEKMVNLKAGWLNSSTGRASMFWSDKYNLVDRALYNTGGLNPSTFNDDVDGMNLSYGGDTSLNDTDGGRSWDDITLAIEKEHGDDGGRPNSSHKN